MESNDKSVSDQLAEKGVELSRPQSGIQIAEVLNVHSTHEQDVKVLRKIDRL
jgi:hypothetical protein